MSKDFYNILGVSKNANQEEIKQAFRKLAHKHHPDKSGGDEAKFKEINEAYQVLSDEKKRKQYDQFGSAAFEGFQGGTGGQGFGGFDFSGFSSGGFEDLGDLFGDFFGGGGRRQQKPRGQDIQVDVELSFYDFVFGVEKTITLTKSSVCERCSGNGAEPGFGMNNCRTCDGAGIEITTERTILGVMQRKRTCSTCSGAGEVPKKLCSTCGGSGIQKRKRTLEITIPSGIEEGSVLRVRGEGEAIKNGHSGDLFVRVHVKSDSRFKREGSAIISEKKIGFSQAALGDTVEIETIDGKVELTIPSGTQSGTEFRLKGKGVQTSRGRGDQFVTVQVITPKKLNRKQKELFEELDLKE
ncbi:molecular chaperone DnaJ [Candidatus Uhrbacteria bacterium]|nr:molecular chaperone DnaJ [Candidatus Uhrbacteria bacterium]